MKQNNYFGSRLKLFRPTVTPLSVKSCPCVSRWLLKVDSKEGKDALNGSSGVQEGADSSQCSLRQASEDVSRAKMINCDMNTKERGLFLPIWLSLELSRRYPGASSTQESQAYEAGRAHLPAVLSICKHDLVCGSSPNRGILMFGLSSFVTLAVFFLCCSAFCVAL